ncbi:hypothetical protein [Streptomyces sparsogenes]|uniref:hypothetical protein n=1 Tax=Streptomyces sparsogenes TaxID=67365 RepID=UPI00340E90BF
MNPYISYVPWRNEEWKGHATKKAVRMAIAYDRGWGGLRLFSHGAYPDGRTFFLEVPRDQWDEMFAD